MTCGGRGCCTAHWVDEQRQTYAEYVFSHLCGILMFYANAYESLQVRVGYSGGAERIGVLLKAEDCELDRDHFAKVLDS